MMAGMATDHVPTANFLTSILPFCSFTVPTLWDKKTETIVNNESSEIIRMFNTAFNYLLPPKKAAIDIYPEKLRAEIDSINEWVYDNVNSESGFAVVDLERGF